MQYRKACSIFYLSLLLLAGCQKRKSVPFFSKTHLENQQGSDVIQLEAHLHDIAIPFHQGRPKLISSFTQAPETIILQYTLPPDNGSLIDFLTKEMDRLGWQSVMNISGGDTLLVYKKPKRRAAFYVNDALSDARLVIFINQDTASSAS